MQQSKINLLIIVPARSKSKGIINKNIKILGDKPLLCWTAKAIHKAKLSNSLAILSTDSEEYKKIGTACGLEVPFLRPSEYSLDSTSAFEVINHSLNWFRQAYRYEPELIMWLQPTSPFRTEKHIQQALAMIDNNHINAVIACKQIHRDQTTLFNLNSGYLKSLAEGQQQSRRQEIEPLLTPNGLMYLIKTSSYKQKQSFYPKNTIPLICDKIASIDIDTEEDWFIAESVINQHDYQGKRTKNE